MKKLKGVFVEIDVPDDFPDSRDLDEIGAYLRQHPEVGEKIEREYLAAYYRWEREGGFDCWLRECAERNQSRAPKDQRFAAEA